MNHLNSRFWNVTSHKIISKHLKLGWENPESKVICEKMNEFVETYSKIGMSVLKYVVVPSVIFPKVFISFFIYFTTDVGNDALDLPLPMWWVFHYIFTILSKNKKKTIQKIYVIKQVESNAYILMNPFNMLSVQF